MTIRLLSPTPASLPFAILTLVNAPYKQGFYCGDDSIRYPYRPDTITHGLMAGVTITATVILVRREELGGWGSRSAWVVFVGKRVPFGMSCSPVASGKPGTLNPFQGGGLSAQASAWWRPHCCYWAPAGGSSSGFLCRCQLGRPTWYTLPASIPAPTSTTMWQLSIRCWGPSCLGPR